MRWITLDEFDRDKPIVINRDLVTHFYADDDDQTCIWFVDTCDDNSIRVAQSVEKVKELFDE